MMRLGIRTVRREIGGDGINFPAQSLFNVIDLIVQSPFNVVDLIVQSLFGVIDLIVQPVIHVVNLLIECPNEKRIVLNLLVQLIEFSVELPVQCLMAFQYEIKFAANVFKQYFEMILFHNSSRT